MEPVKLCSPGKALSLTVPAWSTTVSVCDGYHMAEKVGKEEAHATGPETCPRPQLPNEEWLVETAAETAQALGRRTISAATRGNSNLTLSLFLTRFRMRLENH